MVVQVLFGEFIDHGASACHAGSCPRCALPVAGKYVSALASELPRVNGWSIALRGGDRTPDRTQRLLNHASWDTFAAMSVVRRFAVVGAAGGHRRLGVAGLWS
jgi:hypothetical protein